MSSRDFTPVDEMSRQQLESEVEDRREHQAELEAQVNRQGAALARLINEINGTTADEVGDSNTEDGADPTEPDFIVHAASASDTLLDAIGRVDDLQTTIEDVDKRARSQSASDTDASHWQATVAYAVEHEDHPNHALPGSWVKLFREDVAAATGLSQKRGSQLIDEWGKGSSAKHGTKHQPYKPPSGGSKNNARKKALKIDLDVWREEVEN